MKKKVFHPEARLMVQANKAEGETFRVTALEIEDGVLYVHTGDYADAVDPKRLSVVHQDVKEGKQYPVYYPPKEQMICETEEADIMLRKMLVAAAKTSGLKMTGADGEAGFIAFVSQEEPIHNLKAHRFCDQTMVAEGQAGR